MLTVVEIWVQNFIHILCLRPEYEKLRNNGTRESQDVAPPLYATVVNTDNDYEEPVVDI